MNLFQITHQTSPVILAITGIIKFHRIKIIKQDAA